LKKNKGDALIEVLVLDVLVVVVEVARIQGGPCVTQDVWRSCRAVTGLTRAAESGRSWIAGTFLEAYNLQPIFAFMHCRWTILY
jgi:hypothetical protein